MVLKSYFIFKQTVKCTIEPCMKKEENLQGNLHKTGERDGTIRLKSAIDGQN